MNVSRFSTIGLGFVLGFVVFGTLLSPDGSFKKTTFTGKELPPDKVGIPEEKTFLIVGDVMLGRQVGKLMDRNGNEYPFAHVKEFLEGFDHVVINLEGPITAIDTEPENRMRFRFDEDVARTLADVGITIAGVANNHAFDQGREGHEDTRRALAAAGVAPVGAIDGSEVGNLVRTMVGDSSVTFLAIDTVVTAFHEDALARDLATIDPNTHLVALVHWGDEYQPTHNAFQEKVATFLIDHGVDVVMGSHPHVIQDVGEQNGKPSFYSLGNFIFDQYWEESVERGMGIVMRVSEKGVSYDTVLFGSEQSQPYRLVDNGVKDGTLPSTKP